MENKTCALKEREYYITCPKCNGNPSNICYVTEDDLDEHLKTFAELFEMDNGRLESKFMGVSK